ncbi:MAG: helix-turn-helix domain-containing protein [Treponema sp.]|nr:helix-turn-helix domain-containing protein [Treponema sp.]
MILAEKILELRKQNGWSQEELAEKLDVSRQSVSKWEGAQAVPDLDKVLQMGELFGVSTDYLLKDDMEDDGKREDNYEPANKRTVTMAEADSFFKDTAESFRHIALGVMLCILSPVAIIILAGWSETGAISENVAAAIGLPILFVLIAVSVVIFIINGVKMEKYKSLETKDLHLAYDVKGLAEKKYEENRLVYIKKLCAGVVCCILAVIPLIITAIFAEDNEFLCVCMVGVLLAVVAVGVFLIVDGTGVRNACNILLEKEDYSRESKELNKTLEAFSGVFWLVITGIYLAVSFLTKRWDISWVIWPISAILWAIIRACINMARKAVEN